MRSRASIKGHPIHPMLISYPFAFLTGGWGFGVAGALAKHEELRTVSRYLVPAGVVAGLLAAVPGIIDYQQRVPPESSAKSRATKHALINTTALALFTAGWMLGRGHKGGPLSDGVLICGTVQCPWHGSQFDVRTGDVKCGPAQEKIRTYEMEPVHVPMRSA